MKKQMKYIFDIVQFLLNYLVVVNLLNHNLKFIFENKKKFVFITSSNTLRAYSERVDYRSYYFIIRNISAVCKRQ